VLREKRTSAVLDAKYRDLWERSLPREMLYQLALYAIGSTSETKQAAMVYPTLNASSREQVVVLRDPMRVVARAKVVLRPVNLSGLAKALATRVTTAGRRKCEFLARELAFGSGTPA
jgi:5-methylcytosine-specific restriction enzyme subunit McrC